MKNPIKNTKLISKKTFNDILKTRFGLCIDKDSICKYVDNFASNSHIYNETNVKVFTITFVDSFGFSWSNTNGKFYKDHTKQNTTLYKEFKEFINKHTFVVDKHFFV
jgi:hypothetical protein